MIAKVYLCQMSLDYGFMINHKTSPSNFFLIPTYIFFNQNTTFFIFHRISPHTDVVNNSLWVETKRKETFKSNTFVRNDKVEFNQCRWSSFFRLLLDDQEILSRNTWLYSINNPPCNDPIQLSVFPVIIQALVACTIQEEFSFRSISTIICHSTFTVSPSLLQASSDQTAQSWGQAHTLSPS